MNVCLESSASVKKLLRKDWGHTYVFVCGAWEGMPGEGHLLGFLCHVRVEIHTNGYKEAC